MTERQLWRNFDWVLLILVLILCGISISMVYSATATTAELSNYWLRQTIFTGLGLLALFAIALFDYRNLELLALPAFFFFIISLVAVDLVGDTNGTGSQRWLDFGITKLQPTESGKFLLIIFFAWYLSWYRDARGSLWYILGALACLVVPLALIYIQPDLGTTLSFAFIGGVMILISGVQFWQIGLLLTGGLAALPFLFGSLEGYMIDRWNQFMYPELYEKANYNVTQALIAIGSGGWLGQGWGQGTQNQLRFLRVRHTDFIFSVVAEEMGMIGSALILALLFVVIWRLLNIADKAQDHFGRLLAVGVAALITFQLLVSVGMNLNLLPVTGLTLPFISYGGSSLISMMFAIGLAQSVIMRHRKMEFQY